MFNTVYEKYCWFNIVGKNLRNFIFEYFLYASLVYVFLLPLGWNLNKNKCIWMLVVQPKH